MTPIDELIKFIENHGNGTSDRNKILTVNGIYEYAKALQLLQPDISGSKCSRKCKECNKLVFDCSDFCSKRCETAYYR